MSKLYQVIPNFYGGNDIFKLVDANTSPHEAGCFIYGLKDDEQGMPYWLLLDEGELYYWVSLPEGFAWEPFEAETGGMAQRVG